MKFRLGFIPYLNMVPFHQGFGPAPVMVGSSSFEFEKVSPRALGISAEGGRLDAGAMSLVDAFRLGKAFEPLGHYGIGVHRAAKSVLLFSKRLIGDTRGMVAVTDETSTSVKLLQVLLEKRYGRNEVSYGRIASCELFDGNADALLLIGDEALRARREGIRGFPVVTDLGEEWFSWQGLPFVFARWMVRKGIASEVKYDLDKALEQSLAVMTRDEHRLAEAEGRERGMDAWTIQDYWNGFSYRFTSAHLESIRRFEQLLEDPCLTA